MNFSLEFMIFALTLCLVIYGYFKWVFQYWERKGIPYIKPSIPFGNIDNPLNRSRNTGMTMRDVYNQLKARNLKFGGCYMFTTPVFVPVDPEIIRNILTKDFK